MEPTDWHPGRLMEVSGSYWQTCTLHAAVKLDLFSAIDDAQHNADTLARTLDCNKDGLERLLNAATAMGLLEKTGSQYANSETSRRFLSRHSEQYIGYFAPLARWMRIAKELVNPMKAGAGIFCWVCLISP